MAEHDVTPLTTKANENLVGILRQNENGTTTITDNNEKQLVAFYPIRITMRSEKYGFGGRQESIDHIKGNKGEAWHIVISFPEEEAVKASHDEIGSLAKSLNRMAANLQNTMTSRDKLIHEVEQRQKSEENLQTLLQSIPIGIMLVDSATHEIVTANPKASLMIGSPLKHLVGSQCHHFICPSEKGKCLIPDFGQSVDNSESELLNAYGENIPILKTVFPVIIDDRKLFIKCFVDITDRKKAEEELRQHEKLQGVIEMAGGVCHELNQPMQAISGYSEIIMMGLEDDNPLYEKIKSIKLQIERLRDITKKLMKITRYETTDYLNSKIIDIDKATK